MPGSFRAFLPAALALAGILAGEGRAAASPPGGSAELEVGRAAYARRDYAAAVSHLQAAVQSLDRERERSLLAEAYLDLGLSYMAGSGDSERALAALRESAEMAENPANALLLAATAAEKLGRAEEAAALRDRALHPAPPPKPETPSMPPAPPASPAPSAPTPAAPVPTSATPPAPPGAFEHFFAKEQEKPASPVKERAKKPETEKAKDKEKPKEKEPEKEKPKAGTAFDHFFKKPPDSPPETPAPPPPPGTI